MGQLGPLSSYNLCIKIGAKDGMSILEHIAPPVRLLDTSCKWYVLAFVKDTGNMYIFPENISQAKTMWYHNAGIAVSVVQEYSWDWDFVCKS